MLKKLAKEQEKAGSTQSYQLKSLLNLKVFDKNDGNKYNINLTLCAAIELTSKWKEFLWPKIVCNVFNQNRKVCIRFENLNATLENEHESFVKPIIYDFNEMKNHNLAKFILKRIIYEDESLPRMLKSGLIPMKASINYVGGANRSEFEVISNEYKLDALLCSKKMKTLKEWDLNGMKDIIGNDYYSLHNMAYNALFDGLYKYKHSNIGGKIEEIKLFAFEIKHNNGDPMILSKNSVIRLEKFGFNNFARIMSDVNSALVSNSRMYETINFKSINIDIIFNASIALHLFVLKSSELVSNNTESPLKSILLKPDLYKQYLFYQMIGNLKQNEFKLIEIDTAKRKFSDKSEKMMQYLPNLDEKDQEQEKGTLTLKELLEMIGKVEIGSKNNNNGNICYIANDLRQPYLQLSLKTVLNNFNFGDSIIIKMNEVNDNNIDIKEDRENENESENENGQSCAICLGLIHNDCYCRLSHCCHIFHFKCIKKNIKFAKNNKCPLCRTKYQMIQKIRQNKSKKDNNSPRFWLKTVKYQTILTEAMQDNEES